MLDLTQDIDSLTAFKRHTARYLQQMKQSGRPVVLTVNGRAELVVLDARAYQDLLARAERAEVREAVREGQADVDAGRTVPARAALEAIRQRHGL